MITVSVSRLSRVCILSALVLLCSCSTKKESQYITNRAPLHIEKFIELPLGAIQADGWLHEMLVRQAEGATGHLDELYPEVMNERNGWLGGDGDQWERGPYWIDGLLPLAYILNDQKLIDKTTPWIEWALSSGQSNGQFGPMTDYPNEPGIQRDNCQDWWPRMVVLKVLIQYYNATSDPRVITLMTNYFKYQLEHLDKQPLDNWTFWAKYRGGDNLMCVYWLYNITGDKFLLELGEKLYAQTENFTDQFLARERLSRIGSIHCVNLAQGMKTPLVYWQYDNDSKYLTAIEYALDDLEKFHGYPTGMFSGDEDIHGTSPTQGTELCTIVEYMFTMETMYKITGNPRFAEILEKVAFNALPAQTTDDYMTRQYYQLANQISSKRTQGNFDCNHGVDNCFGLLTGYPCCTSNMHQGWPKFVQNMWYATPDGGLAATEYGPSRVSAKVRGGCNVTFVEDTKYPFEATVRFSIAAIDRAAEFPVTLRIPSWSSNTEISVNGNRIDFKEDNNRLVTISRTWNQGDSIVLTLTPEIKLSIWNERARTVERGPLVYSMNIPSKTVKTVNTIDAMWQGDWYYEIEATADWNYALTESESGNLDEHYTVDESAVSRDIVFPWNEENAPIRISTDVLKAESWHEYNGMAGPLPYSAGYGMYLGAPSRIELIPYGCTTLRITEFPYAGRHNNDTD